MAHNNNLSFITSTPLSGGVIGFRGTGEGDAARKRLQLLAKSPDQMKCMRCDNEVQTDNYAKCNGCKLKFCTTCTGLSKQAFTLLIVSGEIEDYNWKCRSCKTISPTLESIDKSLQQLTEKQEIRLTNLESKMENLETTSKVTIQTEVQAAKVQIKGELHDDIKKMVESRTKEMDDRRRRELNIIVFNMPEGTNPRGTINKEKDEETLSEIVDALGVPDLQIETSYRLGKKPDQNPTNPTNPRPLKAILKDRKQRKKLLENAHKIKETVSGYLKDVIIIKDQTYEQREEKKKKRQSKNKNKDRVPQLEDGRTPDPVPPLTHEINDVFNNVTIPMDQTVVGGIDSSQPNAGYAATQSCG